MRAILIATGYRPELEPLMQHRCSPLIKVVDKYIIFHILEYLAREGIKEFHLILHHFPHLVEKAVGDGDRWGIDVIYHLAKDPINPFQSIRPLSASWGSEFILLGMGDALPKFNKHPLRSESKETIMFIYPSEKWSGWGIVPAYLFKNLPKTTKLNNFLNSEGLSFKRVEALPFIETENFQEIIQSNIRFITDTNHTGLYPAGAHMADPGVWISPAVAIHSGIVIHPPIFIGPNCQIQDDVELGPNAIIERNCIIGKKSFVENSLICQRSIVGEGLNISNSLVDRNLLINLSHDSILYIRDDFILSSLKAPRWINYLLRWTDRFFALLLFILFSPIFLAMLFSCKLKSTQMLLLPAKDQSSWQTFGWYSFISKTKDPKTCVKVFGWLPTLINIMLGQVAFVGVPPRTIQEVLDLPLDWQKLYIKCRVGLISLDTLESDSTVSSEDRYAAEAYYAVKKSPLFNLKVFLRWLKLKFF